MHCSNCRGRRGKALCLTTGAELPPLLLVLPLLVECSSRMQQYMCAEPRLHRTSSQSGACPRWAHHRHCHHNHHRLPPLAFRPKIQLRAPNETLGAAFTYLPTTTHDVHGSRRPTQPRTISSKLPSAWASSHVCLTSPHLAPRHLTCASPHLTSPAAEPQLSAVSNDTRPAAEPLAARHKGPFPRPRGASTQNTQAGPQITRCPPQPTYHRRSVATLCQHCAVS